ncbi:MAG TPA: transposase [Candidatus Hydrogenedentes bacterium]|nr:transposase [Candidatus Hydrogenedentota bacterium]HOL77145.1 transposase [Candidatus Hydrogenedentota bacterium]HPO85916.1 transposase [Candidatus Hydrogenedentota bacterium]
MPYDPNRHHRRSIRLKAYDYTEPGAYFITIVTHERMPLFGDIVNGEMRLNEYGQIVRDEWLQTAVVRPYVVLHPDEFAVMPNHVHGMIWIVDTDADGGDGGDNGDDGNEGDHGDDVGAQRRCAPTPSGVPPCGARTLTPPRRAVGGVTPNNVIAGSLGAIVRAFKSMTTRRINTQRNTPGAPVWQRNYYEHIIRNESDLNTIRGYILENPLRWHLDCENPARIGSDLLAQAIQAMFREDNADRRTGGDP